MFKLLSIATTRLEAMGYELRWKEKRRRRQGCHMGVLRPYPACHTNLFSWPHSVQRNMVKIILLSTSKH